MIGSRRTGKGDLHSHLRTGKFLAGTLALVGFLLPATTTARPSSSAHPFPSASVKGVTRLCGPSAGYSCTGGGYAGKSEGWPGTLYGRGYASSNRYGFHNCTLYAAYRLWKNGLGNPGWSGNATDWDTMAPSSKVNQTPAVGSIAQWNQGYGHVAYVEKVTSSYIEITDDNFKFRNLPGNYTDRFRIARNSAAMPDNFIHLRDVKAPTAPAGPTAPTSRPHWEGVAGQLVQLDLGPQGELWGVNSAGNIYQYAGRGQWTLRGSGFKDVTVGVAGDGGPHVYATRTDGSIVRWRTGS
jgi:surface antigen